MCMTGDARDPVRYLVELDRTGDSVRGSVSVEGHEAPRCFSGWLEFLALLEAPQAGDTVKQLTSGPDDLTEADVEREPASRLRRAE